jgi:hypothetical protein
VDRALVARFAACALVLGGCVFAPLDQSDKQCPCGIGWVCDETRDRCVRASTFDGGEREGGGPGLDSGPRSDADETEGDSGMSMPDGGPPADRPPIGDPNTACDDLLDEAFFCESFEDLSLLRWPTREELDGTARHSVERAFRGTGAIRAITTAPGGFAELLATSAIGGISDGELYVRGYAYIPAGFELAHASFVHVGGHRSRTPTETLAGFNVYNGMAGMYVGAGNVTMDQMLVAVPRDAWFCFQFHLHVADVGGTARLWIDEELAGELLDIDTLPAAPYETLGAGVAWSYTTQLSAEIHIDELAASRTPLPCE